MTPDCPSRHFRLVAGLLLVLGAGCATADSAILAKDPAARLSEVEKLTARATAEIEAGDLDEGKSLLLEAIAWDSTYASARNNLGVVLLRQGDHYRAAWEFHLASKLDPEAYEPLHNLGRVYEEVGRDREAVEHYERALAVNGNALVTMENLALLYVKLELKPEEALELVRDVALRESDPRWKEWAADQIIRLSRKRNPEEDE